MDLNKAIRALGFNLLQQYFDEFCKIAADGCKNASVVSVGSGRGTVEWALTKQNNVKIVCIDPNPSSYQQKDALQAHSEIAPHFATVEEMLMKEEEEEAEEVDGEKEKRGESKGEKEYALFINWAFPNDSTYDFDAIYNTNAALVLCVCDTSGGAGGTMFYRWLKQRTDLDAGDGEFLWAGDLKPRLDEKLPRYRVLATTVYHATEIMGDVYYRYILLQRRDLSEMHEYGENLSLPSAIQAHAGSGGRQGEAAAYEPRSSECVIV